MYIYAGVNGSQKASDPLVLELEATVRLVVWVLGAEPVSSARAVSTLNHRAISSALSYCCFCMSSRLDCTLLMV